MLLVIAVDVVVAGEDVSLSSLVKNGKGISELYYVIYNGVMQFTYSIRHVET